ncbi:MAG: AAA family ATPase, partial [Chloroflexi bacterium]|nr:AAA family ATPase [Chloroflexota bacterium]
MASERMQRRIERLLDQIDQAEAQGEWQSVHSLAQDVLEVDPGNGDATVYLRSAERRLAAALEIAGFSSASPTAVEPTATAPDAERRQLTVMFCDLQGSTALSQQLDPEVLRDVIRSYQEVCAGAVSKFDGHIAKYLGDGLLVYFGYPQAHEDDPQRAVRAGLAILEDMVALNSGLKSDKDLELTVRIGIHTGLVVAGEMGGGDTLEELAIVGETPNIAARIEGAAEPNGITISDVTANFVQGFFICETMGFHELKGISQPVELFRVLEESGAQTRFDVASTTQLTPLVGRQQEVGLLKDRWEQVEDGLGQVVLISGEAGIGKSRLLQEIYERLAGRSHQIREYRCSPYHQNSALFPVIDFTERLLQFRKEDTSEQRLDKLEGALQDFDIPVTESVPLMAEMLSVPLGDRYPPLNLSPQRQRQDTMELLVQLATENATRVEKPVLTVIEDLHWADPTTLEFMSLWVDRVASARSLTIYTFRPEFVPPWGSRSHLTQITLSRLPRRLTTDMMSGLTGGKEIPEEVVTQIAAKSDGVPLFVEELTRMVVESGLIREVDGRYELSGPLPALAIPSTLQDSLTARLDRLSAVRETVQLAAVLGREFSHELIRAVSPMDDATLAQHLEHLVTSEFLFRRGIPPEANYSFKHALVQDAAYNSLLISRRQQYHQQTANALVERFANTLDAQPELLA